MNFDKLEKNITDAIEEQQLKLGYLKETVRLYYPLSSLNRFLGTACGEMEMMELLQKFVTAVESRLGNIKISNNGERFCIAIPPAGAEYIHNNLDYEGFLADLIRIVGTHGCAFQEVLEQFYKYSDCVYVEEVHNGEFDYLVYFEDGKPDNYRYCFTVETNHVIYHRYTPEDYADFGF